MEINVLSPKLKAKIDRVVKQWVETNLSDEALSTEVNRLLDKSLEAAIMTWLGFERDTWGHGWQLARWSEKPLPTALSQRRDALMAEVFKRLDFKPEEVLSQAEIKSIRTNYRRELVGTSRDLATRQGDRDAHTMVDQILSDLLDENLSISAAEALEDDNV